MNQNKKNLLGLSLPEIEQFIASIDEKRFRAGQIYSWLYLHNASSFAEMTNLSKSLRQKLNNLAAVKTLSPVRVAESKLSETKKFLFELPDHHYIETVFMADNSRTTVCISSQVGCAMGCRFCATASLGLRRNLETWEIIEQVLAIRRYTNTNITNVVIMGMGEPFDNYDNVMKACMLLNAKDGLGISKGRIVISTSGIVPEIFRMADEYPQFKLAISLNAPSNEKRNQIMPINRRWQLAELLNAARYYTNKSRHRVTFEYVLMEGFNDTADDAELLKKLLKGLPCKINLIPYNEADREGKRPQKDSVERFYSYFKNYDATVSIRWSKGTDIQAACGQLAAEAEK